MTMMQTEREYAEALFTLAAEEHAAEDYLRHLGTVKQLLEDNAEYIEFLASPAIPMSERIASLDEAFGNAMPEYIVSFLKVLCENGKVRTLFACIDEFEKLTMAFLGTTVATVYSAVPLSEEQKQGICRKIEQMTGKHVDPVYTIDESLIGGLKVEVDGKTFDGSIKHRLGEMKDVMSS